MDPVHPAPTAYRIIAETILKDINDLKAQFSNIGKKGLPNAKCSKVDLSLQRDGWVNGCTDALPRRDTVPMPNCGNQRGCGGYRSRLGLTFSAASRGPSLTTALTMGNAGRLSLFKNSNLESLKRSQVLNKVSTVYITQKTII